MNFQSPSQFFLKFMWMHVLIISKHTYAHPCPNLLLFQLGGTKGGVFVRYFIWRKEINHDTHACMTCMRRCQSVGHIGWSMCQWAIVSTVVLTKYSFLPNSTRLPSIVTLLVHTALEMASTYVMVLLRYGHFAFWNGKHKKKGHWHRGPLRFSTLILNFWSSSRVIGSDVQEREVFHHPNSFRGVLTLCRFWILWHWCLSQVLAATQTPGEGGNEWFQGTADAVRQYLWLFEVQALFTSLKMCIHCLASSILCSLRFDNSAFWLQSL